MLQQTGNMSSAERTVSALLGAALAAFALRRASGGARLIAGAASAALLARAWAAHCGVKSTLQGHTTLTRGLADQWDRMSSIPRTGTQRAAGLSSPYISFSGSGSVRR